MLTPLLVTTLQGLIDDDCLDINAELVSSLVKYRQSDIQAKAKFIIESNNQTATALLIQIPAIIDYYDYSLGIYTAFSEWVYEWCVLMLGDNYGGDKKFISTLMASMLYMDSVNESIDTSIKSLTVGAHSFTSSDDLATGNLTGTTTDTESFGDDLEKTGSLIDLSSIEGWGSPQSLIEAMINTNSLSLIETELDAFGMNLQDLTDAVTNRAGAPLLLPVQQRIYEMSTTITGSKLGEIMSIIGIDIPQNEVSANNPNTQLYFQNGNVFQLYRGGDCRGGLYYRANNMYYPTTENYALPNNTMINNTGPGIFSLSDLMNPEKIFPNSFRSVKMPSGESIYNQTSGISSYTSELTTPLESVMPTDIAKANKAFSNTMQHIKNIRNVNVKDLSSLYSTTETTKGLPLVNALPRAIEPVTVAEVIETLGDGSNLNQTYLLTDFVGSVTGEDHITTFEILTDYQNVYDLSALEDAMDAVINNDPGAEIQLAIAITDILGDPYYGSVSSAHNISLGRIIYEQKNLDLAGVDLYSFLTATNGVIGFNESLHSNSDRTDPDDMVYVLEQLAMQNLNGEALIGAMREGRNLQKLDNFGIETDTRVTIN